MKYLFLLLTVAFTNSFAQDYHSQLAAHREKYKEEFLTDANSPLKKADLENLRFYNADSAYRVNADIQLLTDQQPFKMRTFVGTSHDYIRYAILKFTLNGTPQQLTLYRSIRLLQMEKYKDDIFLPFNDDTNGKETYGGGRYIDLKITDIKDGHIEVDFNKAYNPYCAYSDQYQCPKPPDENRLHTKIEAGEQQFAAGHH
jgi:uncharacterized protein (DUF1684 family)